MADSSAVAKRRMMPLIGRSFILLGGAAAITSSIFAIYSCQFFSYRALDGEPWDNLTPPFDDLAEASVGLFHYSTDIGISDNVIFGDQCMLYESWADVGQSIYFLVAQWGAMVAPGAAFLAMAQIMLEFCYCRLKGSYVIVRLCFFVACVLQACTFMIFMDTQYCFDAESQNQCRLQTGGWYSMGSSIMYLILTIFVTSMAPYTDRRESRCCIMTTGAVATGGAAILAAAGDGEKVVDEDENIKPAGDTDESDDDGYNDVIVDAESEAESEAGAEDEAKDLEAGGFFTAFGTDVDRYDDDEELIEQVDSTAMLSEGEIATSVTGDIMSNEEPGEERDLELNTQDTSGSTVHSRSPDFLDSMCCGDPLELEQHMDEKEKVVNFKAIKGLSSRRMAPSTVGPQPTTDTTINPSLGAVL